MKSIILTTTTIHFVNCHKSHDSEVQGIIKWHTHFFNNNIYFHNVLLEMKTSIEMKNAKVIKHYSYNIASEVQNIIKWHTHFFNNNIYFHNVVLEMKTSNEMTK